MAYGIISAIGFCLIATVHIVCMEIIKIRRETWQRDNEQKQWRDAVAKR